MKKSDASQQVMNSYDECNDLLLQISKLCNTQINDTQSENSIINSGNQKNFLSLMNQNSINVQNIASEISQKLLDMVHYANIVEEQNQISNNNDNYINQLFEQKNSDFYSFIKEKQMAQVQQIQLQQTITQLQQKILNVQSEKDETNDTLIKMEADYKSMQRKMEIYFKRRLENIQVLIKNLQLNYLNTKEVEFTSLIKKLEKMRRKRPWRDHNIDILLEEDKKNLQLHFLEGQYDGTSTPFSNYSGVLTTGYQIPIDSQLEKDLNHGGYLEDLAFNSFNYNNSISQVSQLQKKQKKPKNQIKNILRQYYDEMVQKQNNQFSQINNEQVLDQKIFNDSIQENQLISSQINEQLILDLKEQVEKAVNSQTIHKQKQNQKTNIKQQSNQKVFHQNFLNSQIKDDLIYEQSIIDQSNKQSASLGQSSYYNNKQYNDDDQQEESLSISAKELILLEIHSKEQETNSFILENPKHVQIEEIVKVINQFEKKDKKEEEQLDYILNEVSEIEVKISNLDGLENKRRKSKKKNDQEDFNNVQIVQNKNFMLQNLGLSALLEDEIEPIEIQKKEKIIDNSKFSELLADVSEIKANISQRPSFSAHNTLNTPAHIQFLKKSQKQMQNNSMNKNRNSQFNNFINYKEDEIVNSDSLKNNILQIHKDQPISPHMVIKGIINGEVAACISIYDDKTTKNSAGVHMPRASIVNESNNNVLLPIFDESKISRVFSSANNSFDFNNEYKSNYNIPNFNNNFNNFKKRDSNKQNPKSSRFKDASKEYLSNSDILNDSNLKQGQQQPTIYHSLQQIPETLLNNQDKLILNSNNIDQSLNFKQRIDQNGQNQTQNNQQFLNFGINQKEDFIKVEKIFSKIQSPNISLFLGENMNVSEIKKKNNQEDDLQVLVSNNLNVLLSRDEKLFNDSKNNLSELLDQYNSINEAQRNNIICNITGSTNINADIQEDVKRHYINFLDQLSSISDEEYNEQNSLKSPLKETVHLRFDYYDNEKNKSINDLNVLKNNNNLNENILTNSQQFVNNNQCQELYEENQKLSSQQDLNDQIIQIQEQKNQNKLLNSSLSPKKQQKNVQIVKSDKNEINNQDQQIYEFGKQMKEFEKHLNKFEQQATLQSLINENNHLIKLLKNSITTDNNDEQVNGKLIINNQKLSAQFQKNSFKSNREQKLNLQYLQGKEYFQDISKQKDSYSQRENEQKFKESEAYKIYNQKEKQNLSIKKIFSISTSGQSPLKNTSKTRSVSSFEEDNQNFTSLARKNDTSPKKNMLKSNLYLKYGIYSRPVEFSYLHRPSDAIRSLQSYSPKLNRENNQATLTQPQTPNKFRLQQLSEEQNNHTIEDSQRSQKKENDSRSSQATSQKEVNNLLFMKNDKLNTKPPSYDNSQSQYVRKSFNFGNQECKFSQEKQKILHIIQKKLDLVQTREFHTNMQQIHDYKQNKLLVNNPFHRRQKSSYHEQSSASSFSQKHSVSSLSNLQQYNQTSLQNLSSHQHENQTNHKQKLITNYSESVIETTKRKMSCSPSKKLINEIKEYKIKDSPLLFAIQKMRFQSSSQHQQQN